MFRPVAPACVAFGLACGLALSTSAAAQPGKKVHAVLILDTNSNLKDELLQSEKTVRDFLTGGVSPAVLNIVPVRGDEVTGEKIQKHIARLTVGADDTLFVYIGGHGATVGGKHAFQFTGNGVGREEFVPRDDVRELIENKRARLAVLMTDTCSDIQTLPLKRLKKDEDIKAFGVEFGVAPAGPRGAVPCFEKLFLKSAGVVDINSSYEGTMAWSFSGNDGVFTQALRETFGQFARQDNLTWFEFYEQLKKNTQATFRDSQKRYIAEHGAKFPLVPENPQNPDEVALVRRLNKAFDDLKKQPRQTTQAFHLPDLWLQVIATGVTVDELLLTSPLRRTPAADGLMPRDVILAINNKPVEDTKSMATVIAEARQAAPGETVTLTFKVMRDGQTIERRFTLAKPK